LSADASFGISVKQRYLARYVTTRINLAGRDVALHDEEDGGPHSLAV